MGLSHIKLSWITSGCISPNMIPYSKLNLHEGTLAHIEQNPVLRRSYFIFLCQSPTADRTGSGRCFLLIYKLDGRDKCADWSASYILQKHLGLVEK